MRFNSGGIILILIGGVLLLQNLGLFNWGDLWRFWPVALILAGVAMLFPQRDNR